MTYKTISVMVPDLGWRLQVERVLERDQDVWVLARLQRPPGPAAAMLHLLEAPIPVPLPGKNLRVFVAGKIWAWANKEPCEFVKSLDEVMRRAGDARVLYAAPPRSGVKQAK